MHAWTHTHTRARARAHTHTHTHTHTHSHKHTFLHLIWRWISCNSHIVWTIFLFYLIILNLFFLIPLPICPSNVTHLISHPCLQEDVPTHPPSPLTGASCLQRVRCILSHWSQTRKTSALCVGASYQLGYAAWYLFNGWKISEVQVSWDCWSSYRVSPLLNFFKPFLVESNLKVPQKIGNRSTWRPVLGIYSKDATHTHTHMPQGHVFYYVHSGLI